MAAAAAPATMSPEDRYANIKKEEGALQRKIVEMEAEADQHRLVVNSIKDLDASRRCFRLIGGVLVERTVGEVLPVVAEQLESITNIVNELKTRLGKKSNEALALQRELGVAGGRGPARPAGGGGGGAAAPGVLA